MGTIIQENEIENLKMKVIGLKNEIPQEMWNEFCEWLNSEVGENPEYSLKDDLEYSENKIENLEMDIEKLEDKLAKIERIIED